MVRQLTKTRGLLLSGLSFCLFYGRDALTVAKAGPVMLVNPHESKIEHKSILKDNRWSIYNRDNRKEIRVSPNRTGDYDGKVRGY